MGLVQTQEFQQELYIRVFCSHKGIKKLEFLADGVDLKLVILVVRKWWVKLFKLENKIISSIKNILKKNFPDFEEALILFDEIEFKKNVIQYENIARRR